MPARRRAPRTLAARRGRVAARVLRAALVRLVPLVPLVVAAGVAQGQPQPQARPRPPALRVASPDGRNVVTVELRDGVLHYAVSRGPLPVILPSRLGFAFRGARLLGDSLWLADTTRRSVDTTWTQPWGEVRQVRDRHNELRVGVV